MRVASFLAALLLLLIGCAPVVEEPELPVPPIPPPRAQVPRAPAASVRPQPPTAEPDATAPGAEAAAEPAPEPAPPAWRVARDGTLGCADPAPLSLARQSSAPVPRVQAEARLAGGCRTTFRVNRWALIAEDGDLVRLRLVNGNGLELWFLRGDLIAP